MKTIRYMDFLPAGNKTALVLGDEFRADEKKRINDAIMAADPEIEQVGFVGEGNALQMAGGEFCGNATRSAAYYYLKGRKGDMTMTVSGENRVACGVCEDGSAWCEIPLGTEALAAAGIPQLESVAPGISKVSLSGMTHLVIDPEVAAPYLTERENLKPAGLALIEQYGLKYQEGAGAIFLERLEDGSLKINPIVWVRDIASLFYETACGSGTVATAIVLAYRAKADAIQDIIQPSGMTIRAEVSFSKDCVTRAVISGPVRTDFAEHTVTI